MIQKIENTDLLIFDGIDENNELQYKSFKRYLEENYEEQLKNDIFFEYITKYIYVENNHLFLFPKPIFILNNKKIQEGLLVKEENIKTATNDEINVIKSTYYKLPINSYMEIFNVLSKFENESYNKTEQTINKEFTRYMKRKIKNK